MKLFGLKRALQINEAVSSSSSTTATRTNGNQVTRDENPNAETTDK
jgi:hypothetical protein